MPKLINFKYFVKQSIWQSFTNLPKMLSIAFLVIFLFSLAYAADSIIYYGESSDIHSINLTTGVNSFATTIPISGNVNSLAANPDNNLVYYGNGTTMYYWDPSEGTGASAHYTLADLSTFAGFTGGFLESAGAGYYDGALYVGSEDASGNFVDVFALTLSADGKSVNSLTRLNVLNSVPGGSLKGFGDLVVTGDGTAATIYMALGDGSGQSLSKFDTSTNTWSLINDTLAYRQIAADEFGNIYTDDASGNIQLIDKNTGALGNTVVTTTNFPTADLTGPHNVSQKDPDTIGDYGDAPASYGDARHKMFAAPTVYLGSKIDGEDGSQHSVAADADDNNDTSGTSAGTDEDGLSTPLTPLKVDDTSYSLTVVCEGSAEAVVAGWIDLDGNGSFTNTEKVSGVCNDTDPNGPGSVTLTWDNNNFADTSDLTTLTNADTTYVRLRIVSLARDFAGDIDNPVGTAVDGEVEDYELGVVGAPLTLVKTWSNAKINDAVNVTADGTNDGIDDITHSSIADMASETDTDTDTLTVFAGDTVELNESFTIGNASDYITELTCIGNNGTLNYINGDLTGTLVVDVADTAIICTFTNTGIPNVLADKTSALLVDGDTDGNIDPGDTVRYTVTITNSGSGQDTGVIFADTPDSNTTLVVGSVTTTQGTVTTGNTAGDTTVAVDVGTIAGNGGTVTITFDVTVNDPLGAGVMSISNQGEVDTGTDTDIPTDDPDDPTNDPNDPSDPSDPTIDVVQRAPIANDDSAANPAPVSPSNPTTISAIQTNDDDAEDGLGNGDPATIDLDPTTPTIDTTLTNSDGTWTVDPTTGDVTFTPDASLTGNPTPIPYTIEDSDGNTSNEATLTVTYGGAPIANDDSAANPAPVSPSNPTTISAIQTNDDDAEGGLGNGDPATIDLDPTTPTIDTTLTNSDGTWTVDPTTGDVTFTPDASLTGNPTPIPYTIEDSDGNTSNEATLTVTYGGAPIANDDSAANLAPVSPSNPTTISAIQTNDDDAEDGLGNGDPATIDLDPTTPTIDTTLTNSDGTWTVDPTTGDVTFTPDASLTGNPTPIPYTIEDSDGNTSNEATLTVTYGGAPIANDDSAANLAPVSPSNPTTISAIQTNDDDAEDGLGNGDPATIDLDPTTPTIDTTLTNSDGTWTVDPTTGDVTFTPDASLTGNPTPIPYTIEDSDGNTSNEATLTVTYGGAPIANDDSAANLAPVSPSNPTTISAIQTNDDDAEDGLGNGDPATIDLDPTTPTIDTTLTNSDGTWTVDPTTGDVTFTPDASLTGNPTPIPYTIEDSDGNTSNEATLTVTYGGAPIANDDSAANPAPVSPSNPTTISAIQTNDDDAEGGLGNGDPATIDLDPTTPTIDTTLTNSDGTWTVDPTTGDVTFTPDASLTGNPTPIPYTIEDSDGNTSNEATLTVTYGGAPIANDDSAANLAPVSPSNPTTISAIQTNDDDAEDGLGNGDPATIDLDPTTPTIDTTLTNSDGTWTVDPTTGDVTFTPDASLTGNPTPIPYTIEDSDGNTSNEATLTVTYGGAPIANDDSAANLAPVSPSNPTTISAIQTNDDDAEDGLGNGDPATIDLDPTTPTIDTTLTNSDGTWTVDPTTGDVTFTPDASLTGNPTPIPYTIEDSDGNTSNEATLTVTYGGAPIANDDSAANLAPVSPSNPTTISAIQTNDDDAEDGLGNGDPATIDLDPTTPTIDTTLTNSDGTWTVDPTTGDVTFTPDASLTGNPTPIPYTIEDSDGNTSNEATLTVTYGGAPIANDDSAANLAPVSPSNPTTISAIQTNDDDAEDGLGNGDPATIDLDPTTPTIDTTLTNSDGTWTVDPTTGDVTFTPDASLTGNPTPIPYTIEDSDGNTSNEATLTVTYGGAPIANDDSAANLAPVSPSNPTTISAIQTNDDDAEDGLGNGDPATIDLDPTTPTIDTTLTNSDGTWTVDPTTGDVTFTPDASLTGNPTPIPYTIEDSDGNTSNEATLTVTYGGAPIANDDSAANLAPVSPSNPTTISAIQTNDDDAEDGLGNGDPATIDLDPTTPTIDTTLTNSDGTWTVDPTTGDVTFTPDASLTGNPTPIPYTIEDSDGNTSNEATLTVTYGGAQTPNIEILKTATPSTIATAGEVVSYTITATNTGNVTLEEVVISDPLLTNLSCELNGNNFANDGSESLAVGEAVTCQGSYTATLADIDTGEINNVVAAEGKTPSGTPITDTETETVTVTQAPSIEIDKDSSNNASLSVGDTVNYSFAVINTGNVTLDNISVSDPLPNLSAITCPKNSLEPNESMTCTANYVITQGNVDAGSITNTATVTGNPPNGDPNDPDDDVTDTDSETIPPDQAPNIEVNKTATPSTITAVGQVISYTITATNIGNVTLEEVVISDPLLTNLSCELNGNNFANDGSESLAVGEAVTCQGSYTATLADIDTGEINNVVAAEGKTPSGTPITDTETETVTVTQAPSIEIDKDSSNNASLSVGDTVNYSFAVINTGNVTLDNISVSDPLPNLSAITCPKNSLEPNESMTCTANYVITQGNVDAGSITNTATVTGNPPNGDPNDPDDDVTDTDSETIPPDQAPNIEVNKTATPSTITAVGQVISYTITATNIGNVTLEEVVISDPLLTNLSCELNGNNFANDGSESLAVGEAVTCQGSYTATLADIDTGEINNVVAAEGKTPSGTPITDTETETVTVTQAPSIEIDKDSSNNASLSVGDTVNYSFAVINTGNVTLDNISVSDPLPNLSAITCPKNSLEPNESMTCTANYVITQGNVDAGSITNTATVTGNPPNGDPNDPDDDVTDTDSETIPPDQAPNIEVNKTATPSTITAVGQVISYTITATNIGNVTLEEVVISDPLLTNLSCELNGNNFANDGSESLAVGEAVTCQGSYTATLADIDTGEINNVVAAEGKTPSGTPITDTETETVTVTQAPSIEIDKDSSNNASLSVGDTVNYSFAVINTGNVTLDNISVSDPLPNLSAITCPKNSLEPNESMTCTANYVITQGNVDAGSITNTATVTGNPPNGDPNDPDDDVTDTDTEIVPPLQKPVIGAAKDVQELTLNEDTGVYTIKYSITIRNYGNTTLNDIQVSDDLDQTFGRNSYTFVRIDSDDFTINSAYDGSNSINLLLGTDSLAVGESGIVLVTLTVDGKQLANETTFNNSVLASAKDPAGNKIGDTSVHGLDPDVGGGDPSNDNDGDPTNNTRPTPVTLKPKEPGEIALRIEKNVPRRIYTIGEVVPYTVIITSDNQVEDLIIDITDTLPQSTSYVEGTATISVSNAPQEVEFIAQEGQLTWLDVRLPAGEKITITYELLIGLNAPKLLNNRVEAKGTNTTGSAEVSVEANAEIEVSEEIFGLSNSVLIGRVYLDVDDDGSYDFDEDIPLPGARVVLSNGWQTVTDVGGGYMFRSVPVGTASVRLDAFTAPYLPRDNYQGIGDGYLHQVSIYGLSVSDFPFIAPEGAIDAQRRTIVTFGPITLEKKLIPLLEGVRVVLHINSSEPVPYKIRLLDPVPDLETKVFELEEVDGEQTLTYDVPMEIPMTDPTFEWGNQ